jgi:outer membrane protein assembly factor BamD (BamD/ComL family)
MPQRNFLVLLGAILVVGLLVLSPQKSFAQTGSIVGQVRISPGTEIKSPVLINLTSRGQTVNSVYTDNEGRFGFNALPANIYHVEINQEGFLPVREDVSVDAITSSMRLLNIYLVPRDAKEKPSPSGMNGGNTRLTDLNQYNEIAKPARKEYDKGVRSDRDGRFDEAIRHYQKAVELAPGFYEARNNLGSDLLSKSQFVEAQFQFEQVIKVNPTDAAAYFNLGNISLLTKQYDKGQHWVEEGLSKQPDSAFGHFLRGSIDARSGKPNEAEVALKRCLELDPLMSKSHLALVNLYMQQKRPGDAASELRVFLKNFPEDPFAPKAKQVLEKLEAGSSK